MKKCRLSLCLLLALILVTGCGIKETKIISSERQDEEMESKEVLESREDPQEENKSEDSEQFLGDYKVNQVLSESSSGSDVVDPRKITPHPVTKITRETLINKFNALPEDYAPSDLVEINSNGDREMLRKEAAEAWNRLEEKASSQGIHLVVFSSYRTKEDQTYLFENYLKKDPVWAMKYSAYPRRSEHEMGYAVDVSDVQGFPTNFEETKQGQFMAKYAADYGFVLRYPQDKEGITGYAYESWHYRYVGEPLAKELVDKGITLEEYYGVQGDVKQSLDSKEEQEDGKLIVTSSYVNIRKTPNLNGELLGQLDEGQEIPYYEEIDGWYRILYQESSGWIHGDYVTLFGGD